MAAAFAVGAIANLVMILQVTKKSTAVQASGRSSMPAAAESGICSVINKSMMQGFGQMFQFTKIRIIADFLTRQDRVQGVMKIVAPLGVQRKPAVFTRPEQARIIQITFGNQNQMTAKLQGKLPNFKLELFQERLRGE